MSRIQDILKKAERDGSVHRTRALATPGAAEWDRPQPAEWSGRAVTAPPPALLPPLPVEEQTSSTRPEQAHSTSARQAGVDLDRHLVAAHSPQSLAAEQYRSLRTRVKAAENGHALRTIIITSPNKGDGKSLTAANLALTMAQEFQQRVLLVDADLRRPSIQRLFGLDGAPGLSDVLMGAANIEDALVGVPDHRLTIVPSGSVPTHPAELLGSAAMRRVFDTLRTRFDRIIVDMPPVAPLADVAIASSMADGILMIVRAGVTPKPAIERALSGLDMSKVLGLVLNDAGEAAAAYGYGADGYAAG
jgi:capsular exopolysaccharide synthesis family protein